MARKWRRRGTAGRRFVCLACVAILGACWLFYGVPTSDRPARVAAVPDMAPVVDSGGPAQVRPAAIGRPPRPIYPHSVIRGGAYSVAELDAAARADPVVAAHYAVFDRTQMRIARAPDAAAVYVSYRLGDRIYWTRRKVNLAAEEALLTDGVHSARARCGNRISATLPDPARARDPDTDLDLPEPPPTAHPGEPAADPPDVFSLPMVVHEIFPALLGTWLPGGGSGGGGGAAGGGAGGPAGRSFPISQGQSAPPGFTLPILPGVPLPPPVPNVWPIDFTTLMPPQPLIGPSFWWIQPIPLPAGFGTGSVAGTPPVGTSIASRPILGLPPVRGITPFPGITPNPGNPPSPTVSGSAPPPSAGTRPPPQIPLPQSGTGLQVLLADDGTDSQVLLPEDGPLALPLPFEVEIPEPASAALLLCGVVVFACRRRSTRRLE